MSVVECRRRAGDTRKHLGGEGRVAKRASLAMTEPKKKNDILYTIKTIWIYMGFFIGIISSWARGFGTRGLNDVQALQVFGSCRMLQGFAHRPRRRELINGNMQARLCLPTGSVVDPLR